MGGGKRSRDASSSSHSRSPEPVCRSRSASSFCRQGHYHERGGMSPLDDECRQLFNDSGDLSGWVEKAREDDLNECSLSQNRQALPSSYIDPVLGYSFFDVQNKGDIPTQELGKDNMAEEPPEIRISSPVMLNPTKREEYSTAESARDKLCMNLRRALAAAADTEEWYAKETQRKYAMRNLTVESTFCDVDDGSTRSYKARKVAVVASQFVVSLSSFPGIGGPLVNYSGHVLGINFYEENHTPFLSTAVVLRCLEHWDNYHKIIRPWLGFKYTSLDMVPLKVLEKCPCVDKGLYISNVAEGSPADVAGLCVGDILIECAGESISTAPKFGALLLDISSEHIETHSSNRKINLSLL